MSRTIVAADDESGDGELGTQRHAKEGDLIDLVRLRSGALPDDVAILLARRGPPMA